jgi:hypothetical protein
LQRVIPEDIGFPLLEYLAQSGWGEALKNGHMADAQNLDTTYSSA